MPALPPVPNVLQVKFNWAVGSDQNALVRCYVSYTGGPPSSADCNTLAAAIATAYNTNLRNLAGGDKTLHSIQLTDLSSSSGAQGQSSPNTAGTRAGSALPASVCCLVNDVINRRYRGGKPRQFWPFGVQADISAAQAWSNAFVTAVNTQVGAFWAAVIGLTGGTTVIAAHVSVSYYQGFTNVAYGSPQKYRRVPTLRGGGPVIDVITTHQCNTIYGTQRRRLRP